MASRLLTELCEAAVAATSSPAPVKQLQDAVDALLAATASGSDPTATKNDLWHCALTLWCG